MLNCLKCASGIEEYDQHYIAGDMGPEIVAVLEQTDVQLLDENEAICSDCFESIVGVLSNISIPEHDIQHSANMCIWCQITLTGRRCHSVPEGPERYIISERISPRTIPEDGLVCHHCWVRAQRALKEQGISYVPSPNTYVCVWCCRSLAKTRRHSIPEGSVRNEIIAQIYPREIPSGGSVCYACWVAALRNVRRAARVESQQDQDSDPSHHYGEMCVWCRTSLYRRQVRNLIEGPERDVVAAGIHPRELPEHARLCLDCWTQAQQQNNNIATTTEQPVIHNNHSMSLDNEFKHTPNTSSHCFVPGCSNTERLVVPHHIRKRILNSQKIFVTENSRICAEHKTVNDWDFIAQNEFSDSFSKAEMKAMLRLSISQDT